MKPQSPASSPSRWQATKCAQPLLWWPEDVLHRLAEDCDRVMGEWGHAWGVPVRAVHPCAVQTVAQGGHKQPDAHEGHHAGGAPGAADDGPWLPLGATDRPDAPACAWISRPAEWSSRVGEALFPGLREVRGMAATIAANAAKDAILRLAALFGLEPQPITSTALPAQVQRSWSGALRVGLPPALGGWLVLDGSVVLAGHRRHPNLSSACRTARAPAALHAVEELIAPEPTQVRASLLDVELSLGQLQALRIGDLVRLPHRLEAPAFVTDLAGHALFAAYLGRRGHRKALELVPMPQPAAAPPALHQTSPT